MRFDQLVGIGRRRELRVAPQPMALRNCAPFFLRMTTLDPLTAD